MWDNTENDDTAGFDDLVKRAHLMAWLRLFGAVGFLIWLVLL